MQNHQKHRYSHYGVIFSHIKCEIKKYFNNCFEMHRSSDENAMNTIKSEQTDDSNDTLILIEQLIS